MHAMPMPHIAIFASGTGSNALRLLEYFRPQPSITFTVYSNKQDAPVLAKAAAMDVPVYTFGRPAFYQGDEVLEHLRQRDTQLIVLAGFLWMVPPAIIAAYPRRILNLHPSLLPRHGGKGMYGHHVHAAVLAAGDQHSGITLHFANEQYDKGDILLQAHCPVLPQDTPDSLAQRIRQLEHRFLPVAVEHLIQQLGN